MRSAVAVGEEVGSFCREPPRRPLDSLPRVSVVMPSWQQGRFIRQAIESLLQQTYPHVEIIVYDNQSDDDTPAVLADYADRVSVVRQADRGQADALARGFAACTGSILGWLNADDMLMPDAVERAVAAFRTADAADVVYGHCAFLREDGQFLRYFHEIGPFCADELCNFTDFLAQPSTFFRREAYETVGGIDPNLEYTMDWDLWCRLARAGCRFHFLDAVLSGARHHPATKTAKGGWKRLYEIHRVNRRHCSTAIPVAAASHLYAYWLQPRLAGLHRPLRYAWRQLTARHRPYAATLVHGMGYPGRLVKQRVRIEFPAFAGLGAAHLRLRAGSPQSTTRGLEFKAFLNGRAGLCFGEDAGPGVIEFRWEPGGRDYVQTVVLELEMSGGAAPVAQLESLAVDLISRAAVIHGPRPLRPQLPGDSAFAV